MMKKIPITQVYFDDAELQSVLKPLQSGWVVQGPFVEEFERKFAAFTGAKHAIATTSCTTALHLALAAGGIGPGDEVIVPAFTWVSTANVVLYLGGSPVFCDVDLDTFNIDVDDARRKISSRTKAILPVHLFGLSADMDGVVALAREHGLKIIEDAACGFGAAWRGRHVGTIGDFGCFSFHPRKAITTGEGGMITTDDDEAAEYCRMLRDHGADRTDLQRHESAYGFLLPQYNHLGYNYRMTDLQGAVGSAQMDKAEEILEKRRVGAHHYDRLLEDVPELRRPAVPPDYRHGYQSYVCLFAPERPTLENVDDLHRRRNQLMKALEDVGIATRQGTHAVTNLGFYKDRGVDPSAFPKALMAEKLSLTLPLYPQMTDDDREYVIAHLLDAVRAGLCAE